MISEALARQIARHPLRLVGAALLAGAVSVAWLASRESFDTEIVHLLPGDAPAVRGLEIYNREFSQAREIALVVESPNAADTDAFTDDLANRLRREPWALRVLEASPLLSDAGKRTAAAFVLPLLLNLDPERFASLLPRLQPDAVHARLERLVAQWRAGSPRAQLEIENDPLGIVGPAVAPIAEAIALDDSFSLATPDGTSRLLTVVASDPDLGASASQRVMQSVRSVIDRARADWGAEAPVVLITGRAAYVEEIAASMQRDITITSALSMAMVVGLFWVGFRRVTPLLGIVFILALSSVVALALGSLMFSQVNVIAIGFCSILFGLGDDFSMLLYGQYVRARDAGKEREPAIAEAIREVAPGIGSVVAATGIGFLALWFSGSTGFAQLGSLIAIGMAICGALMITLLLVFTGKSVPSLHDDFLDPVLSGYLSGATGKPRSFLVPSVLVGTVLLGVAVLPWRPLAFDTNTESLEPRDAKAATALRVLMDRFSGSGGEPGMVVVQAGSDAPGAAATIRRILEARRRDGSITTFSEPSPLLISPSREQKNLAALRELPPEVWTELDQSIRSVLRQQELDPAAFASTFDLIDGLRAATRADAATTWRGSLPEDSPWWFLIDRHLSQDSGHTIAYFRSTQPGVGFSLQQEIDAAGVPAMVTGWRQTLESLVPWAQRELLVFGSIVVALIGLVLGFVYRDMRLWAIHLAGLLLATGATVATIKALGTPVNLLNVIAFPLMLAVGVDYGTHLLLPFRGPNPREALLTTLRPVLISGLTTVTGFGALILAKNPSLSGLGSVCAIGVAWCLLSTIFFVVPAAACSIRRTRESR